MVELAEVALHPRRHEPTTMPAVAAVATFVAAVATFVAGWCTRWWEREQHLVPGRHGQRICREVHPHACHVVGSMIR